MADFEGQDVIEPKNGLGNELGCRELLSDSIHARGGHRGIVGETVLRDVLLDVPGNVKVYSQ